MEKTNKTLKEYREEGTKIYYAVFDPNLGWKTATKEEFDTYPISGRYFGIETEKEGTYRTIRER